MNKMTWGISGKEAHLETVLNQVGDGWSKLVRDLIQDLFNLGWDGTLLQIKEKFGGLRFYIGAASDEVHNRIMEAEGLSYKICEYCGKPGEIRQTGWVKCMCDDCYKDYQSNNETSL